MNYVGSVIVIERDPADSITCGSSSLTAALVWITIQMEMSRPIKPSSPEHLERPLSGVLRSAALKVISAAASDQ